MTRWCVDWDPPKLHSVDVTEATWRARNIPIIGAIDGVLATSVSSGGQIYRYNPGALKGRCNSATMPLENTDPFRVFVRGLAASS